MSSRPLLRCALALVCASVLACASTPPAPALHAAVKEGSLDSVRQRLAAGDDINQRESNGLMPLHLALSLGRREIALELIRRGADLNARTRDGSSPLTIAIDRRYGDVLELLLERNAAIDTPTGSRTPLMSAVRQNRDEIVDRLLKAGAQVERPTPDGDTPLHIAAMLGHRRIVERLLAAGANIDAALPDGRTPIHHAVLNTQSETADLLYTRGATVGPATGEVGMFTTALVYRQVAEHDYRNKRAALSSGRLQQAADACRALRPVLEARADDLSSEVTKIMVLNALRFVVGAMSAQAQAKSSLTGTGSSIVMLDSSASPEQLRDQYRRLANWATSEAERMDTIKRCVDADPAAATPCFALHAR